MGTFRYVALEAVPDGRPSRVRGRISDSTLEHARAQLVARGLQVVSLRSRRRLSEIELTRKRIKPQEIANLSRQLSAFLRAGIPIIRALDTIAHESTSAPVRSMLPQMSSELAAGATLSEALDAHVEHFPSYFPGIIRSAELSGNIEAVLDQLADYIDRDAETRRRVKSALMYPGILAAMSMGTVGILVGFVLPKFETFFVGFDAELPMTTRSLLALGTFMGSYGLHVLAAAVAVVALVVGVGRTEPGRLLRNRASLRTPLIRDVIEAAVIERFCRILSAMISAGIPLSDGMAAAIDSTDNRVFSRRLVRASEQMLEGNGFATPIADTQLFPGMVNQMMRVGEETGTLDQQLSICAQFYERELSFKLNRLTTIFEPLIIVVMGGIVGFVAVALVQAMYGVYGQSGV